MIQIKAYMIGPVQTNFYYLFQEGSAEAVAFDPADLGDRIYEALGQQGLKVSAIFLTHAHFDHIMGVDDLKRLSEAPLYALDEERDLCSDPALNSSVNMGRSVVVRPDRYLRDGEVVTAAGITMRVIATPGHTKGSCCYYIEDAGEGQAPILISGDTLFQESVGRSDLPTGSESALIRSIREKLYVLPDETRVFPGHGGMTTIGHEKKHNFFV